MSFIHPLLVMRPHNDTSYVSEHFTLYAVSAAQALPPSPYEKYR